VWKNIPSALKSFEFIGEIEGTCSILQCDVAVECCKLDAAAMASGTVHTFDVNVLHRKYNIMLPFRVQRQL